LRRAQSGSTIRQAHGPEALEGQAHHPEHSRRADGVSKGEKRQLSPFVEHGDSNPVFDITWLRLSSYGKRSDCIFYRHDSTTANYNHVRGPFTHG